MRKIDHCIVFITASGAEEADKISSALIKERLAACVNLAPRISSRYWWKGRIASAGESLLIVKTRKAVLKKLIARVKALHSYTVPEVIAFPVFQGNPEYMSWIEESVPVPAGKK